MKVGTKSVLFGAHCFFIHPFFVAAAWWQLYGFPWDPRLWVAFFVHDLGYWGKPNMDGEEGELHPYLGARIMHFLFDRPGRWRWWPDTLNRRWFDLTLYHSRFLAKRHGRQPSQLCMADKLAVAMEPWWLYLPRVLLTGEAREYMGLRANPNGKYAHEARGDSAPLTPREWQRRMSEYCRAWAIEHADGRRDTWTPESAQVG